MNRNNAISPPLQSSDNLQKILIVDDLEQNLISMRKVLRGLDVEVLTAKNANDGLRILLREKISLAIIDVQMPGMDGFEMARLMQELDHTRTVPIIFVTAINKERANIYKGYLSGAVDYMFVPIDPEILLCKLNIFLTIERRQQQLEEALQQVSRITKHYQNVLDSVNDGILGLESSGVITFVNPSAGRMLGYEGDELVGKHFITLLYPCAKQNRQLEWEQSPLNTLLQKQQSIRFLDGQFWRQDGTSFAVEYSCSTLRKEDDEKSGHVLVFQDITERRIAEEKLLHLANYDSLTGASNRNTFTRSLKQSISRARRKEEKLAVLFFDLNRFKEVNDLYGHAFGDKLLQSVAQRVNANIREEDHLARYGGDEFALLLDDIRSDKFALATAHKIFDAFSEPFDIDEHPISINPSIGISLYPDDGTDPDQLIKAADIAMYEAKESATTKVFRYDTSMEQRLTEMIRTQQALKQALPNNEFSLVYQLYHDTQTGQAIGAEALLRWSNRKFPAVSTEAFVSILEETGLILKVGEWVIQEACRTVAKWDQAGILPDNFHMSVNLSTRQIREQDFIEQFTAVLQLTGVRAELLQLEITESVMMEDPYEAMKVCEDLNKLGVTVAIDDFGTGYSSLAYLARLQVGVLKIDRLFINEVLNGENARKIIVATINLAHNLNYTVIAEGVENKNQLDWLREQGCDIVQGYHLAMPEPETVAQANLTRLTQSKRQ